MTTFLLVPMLKLLLKVFKLVTVQSFFMGYRYQDVPENVVVAGVPARIIKEIRENFSKTALEDALRNL